MKILFTVDPLGAGWSHTAMIARALARRDEDILLMSFGAEPSPGRRAEAEADGVRLVHIPIHGPSTDSVFIATARDALKMMVDEWQPAVVQIDRCAFGDLDLEVPKLLTVAADRTARVSRGRGPARKGLLGADAVVSPTRALAEEISRRFEYRRPISVIQPGIEMGDLPVSVTATRRSKAGVMFYGRVDEKADGFDLLLDSTRLLGGEVPLRIGGEGVRPLLPGWVTDAGFFGAEERAVAFGRAEIAVLPSRDEPFGLLSIEAALSGCALLLSDIPTYRELWHGAAVLVKPEDPRALADALQSLLADARRRDECARLCRARALSGFGADRAVEEHRDVYRRIKRTWAKKAGGPPKLSEDVLPLS
jgi:glycogen(starch) synthase